jgi:hypothetical protein
MTASSLPSDGHQKHMAEKHFYVGDNAENDSYNFFAWYFCFAFPLLLNGEF